MIFRKYVHKFDSLTNRTLLNVQKYAGQDEPHLGGNINSCTTDISGGDSLNVTLTMPGALPKKTDSYLCSAFDARTWSRGEEQQSSHQGNSLPLFIQKFAVDSTAEKVHHLIVKACAQPGGKVGEIWNCMHHSECQGPSKIMYAWAKDAPPADIPNEVGFKIDDQMPFLTLQVSKVS